MARVLGDSFGAIGDTKHSMLTLTQFQAAYGTGWVIADGSSCTGTKYASASGNTTLPDCRGYFLRGYNNGSSNNPDGTAIGGFQGNQLASHTHSGNTSTDGAHTHTPLNGSPFVTNTGGGGIISGGPAFGLQNTTNSAGAHNHTLNINNTGGDETRPSSVTVNIFIRIN